MAKRWILPSIVLTCSLICLLIAVLTPIILNIVQTSQIKENVKLTKSNKKSFWGEIPGKLDVLMTQHYHMFNLTNPEDFMNGARPSVVELNGYKWREHDKFLNISYGDSVKYNLYRYAKRSSKLPWMKNISESDMITSVSLGAFGGWYLVKHFTRQQLALVSLATLAGALETVLPLDGYSISMHVFLLTEKITQNTVLTPAGIVGQQAENIWNDQMYGMSKPVTLQTWILALEENLNYEQEFTLKVPYTSTLNNLRLVFGLTDSQLQLLFSQQFLTIYQLTTLLFYNNFECEEYGPSDKFQYTCDPIYLAGLQWSSSAVTNSPPAIKPLGPSIVSINTTVKGFPEIFYFYNSTGLNRKLTDYQFNSDSYKRLFNYDRNTGYPIYSNKTLLDVGQMNLFFNFGTASDFSGMAQYFNLTNQSAQILWDYVNTIIDYTGLQGCYDPKIYDYDNRGISTEAALGQVGSPTLLNFTVYLSNTLLITITTIYDELKFSDLNITCNTFIGQFQNFPNICNNPFLQWQDGGLALWIQVYWSGKNSTYWNNFTTYGGLSYSQMEMLFDPDGTLIANLTQFDKEIKSNYKCPNYGNRCSSWFLANKQWAQSYVTLNLPPIFAKLNIENSTTITDYPFFKANYTGTPEYGAFALKSGRPVLSDDALVNSLLNFTGLYSPLVMQSYFIQVFARNNTAITQNFGLADPDSMTEYLRYFIDLYFFGGLIRQKTVNDILFTDIDPLTIYIRNLNPLFGGNPAMSLVMTQVGLNKTEQMATAPGNKFRNKVNAGKHKSSHVRKYEEIMGKSYINIPTQYYAGQNPDGTQNIQWIHFNPWNGSVYAKGTDAWQFEPFLSSDDSIYYYLDIAGIIFKMDFKEHKTRKGYNCLRFVINNGVLMNQTKVPSQARYFQNTLNGLTNQTSIFIAPVFGSKPYFRDGDDTLLKMVNFQYPQFRKSFDISESYFDVEKHAGIVLGGQQMIQYNLEIKPDILYPNLGKQNLQEYGRSTYLPITIYQRSAHISKHEVDKKLGDLLLIPKVKLASQIIGYTLFGVFLLNGLFILWRRKRSRGVRSENLI